MQFKKSGVIAVSAIAVLIASAAAYAFPSSGHVYEYHSDASMTESVGFESLSCDGHFYQEGVVTPYRIGGTYKCQNYGGIPPDGPKDPRM